MASSIRQIKFVDTPLGNTGAGTLAGTYDNPVLIGSTLLALVQCNSAHSLSSIADNVNIGNWPAAIQRLTDSNAASLTDISLCGRQSTLPGTPTVTATYSAAATFRGICLVEATVVATASIDKSASQIQASPGTGTDAVTSGNTAALTSQPNLVIAFSMDTSGTAGPPSAGSSPFASNGVGWAWDIGANTLRVESKNTSSTSAVAGTFTAVGGTDRYSTFVVVLLDLASPLITVQPTSQTSAEGSTATFTVTATASAGALSYQWNKNGSNVGTNSSSYTTSAATETDNFSTVYCTVTDSNGSVDTTHVYWFVRGSPSAPWLRA